MAPALTISVDPRRYPGPGSCSTLPPGWLPYLPLPALLQVLRQLLLQPPLL